jgi:hypothetical protein
MDAKFKYKAALKELESMRGASGLAAYKRGSIMLQVFNDQDFRFDLNLADDFAAAEWLNSLVGDLCVTFFDLRDLLKFFPEEQQWAKGNLHSMMKAIEAERDRQRKDTFRKKPTRTAPTRDELNDQKQRADNAEQQAKLQVDAANQRAAAAIKRAEAAESELQGLRAEKAAWEKERKQLNRRIIELERRVAERQSVAA